MGEEAQKQEEQNPQAPLVIHVDLHCPGCAKKIRRYIKNIKGVEGVAVDIDKNQLTIKGVVDHKSVCKIITEKTKRKVSVISPVPEAEAEPIPDVVVSKVDEPKAVELKVNMHCEACAEQLKQKILKLKGVKMATTEFSSGKVVVTGTMDAGKLVDYVYRRTKKQAQIVPAPEPEPEPEPEAGKKEPEPPAAEEKKEESPAEEKKEEAPAEEKKEEPPAEEKKEEEKEQKESKAEDAKSEAVKVETNPNEEENMKKMIYYYQPLYVYESMPTPQLFSDENPNACCIS